MDYENIMSNKEKKIEYLHEKAFTNWLNSILISKGYEVKNLRDEARCASLLIKICKFILNIDMIVLNSKYFFKIFIGLRIRKN